MSTFKKIEKFAKIKKLIIPLTIILIILDTIIAFTNPAYLMNSSSLMWLGFSSYSLMVEYMSYRIEYKEISKIMLIFSVITSVFFLYHIFLNLVNMPGVSA